MRCSLLIAVALRCANSVHLVDSVLTVLSLTLGLPLLVLLQDLLSVLVNLELGDDAVGWVDGDSNGGSVGLLLGDLIDMDAPSSSVDCNDLSISVLEGTSDDLDMVSLSDWDRSLIMFALQVLGQVATH